jgi:tetratricopeptide (TPR) repeat protein
MDRRSAELARSHAVAVFSGASFKGSGFFVDPMTILTCAHVVAGTDEALQVIWGGQKVGAVAQAVLPPEPGESDYYGFPDLARLVLRSPFEGGPSGVWLAEQSPAEGSSVVAYGFSRYTPEVHVSVDTLRLVVVGAGASFLRVSGDQVVPGMSGSLVLDEETGQVCGIVKASRDTDKVQGGWIVPITAVAQAFPDIALRSAQMHRPGTQWFDLARNRDHLQTAIFGRSAVRRARTPAGLLVAAQAAVPFVPREELSALVTWCEQDDPQGIVRLVYAPGGAGKTRLAAKLCADMQLRGWLAGFLAGSDVGTRRELIVEALNFDFPVLAVIDYAQDRLALLKDLLTYLRDYVDDNAPVRILLLARSHQPWWEALAGQLGAAGDWALYRAHTVELSPLTETVRAADLAEDAFEAFMERLGYPARKPPSALRTEARRHRSVLAIHAMALDAALTVGKGDTWKHEDDPLVQICNHEVRIWRERLVHFGTPDFEDQIVPEAVLLVPTLAPGEDCPSTVDLLGRVIELFPAAVGRLNPELVWAALHDLYGTGRKGLTPIEPDRVAEVLVRRVFRTHIAGSPGSYLAVMLTGNARHGLRVLARARGCTVTGRIEEDTAYEELDDAMRHVVRDRPAELIPIMAETGAVLPHAEPIADVLTGALKYCDAAILAEVEPRLPRYPTSLSDFASKVYRRLLEEHGDGGDDADRLRRVHLLTQLSFRLSESGRSAEGMEAATEAMVICADLARRSDDYRPEYAASLNNLSLRLGELGLAQEALRRSMQAEGIYRTLLVESSLDYRLELAATQSNLALRRSSAEHPAAAVEAAEEAVALLEELTPSPQQEALLTQALVNLSLVLMDVGATERAVNTVHRAVDFYRDLAARQPSRYLLDLLDALQVLAVELSVCDPDGSLRSAYIALSEAARLRHSFLGERMQLRDKQRHALILLREWSARIPEFNAESEEWARKLESIRE